MEKITAADIMIPLDKYPHLPYWFTIRQAIVELESSEFDINGKKSLPRVVLVFDEKYQLLGMVRRRDLLRGIQPSFFEQDKVKDQRKLFTIESDALLGEFHWERSMKEIKERAERPVSEVMLPITATVDVGDHIVKIIHLMVVKNLSLIPVMDKDKVVGTVRSVDVLHEVGKIL